MCGSPFVVVSTMGIYIVIVVGALAVACFFVFFEV